MTNIRSITGQVKSLRNLRKLRFVGLNCSAGLVSSLLLVASAKAGNFYFSTGNPDGLMATATRPEPATGPTSGVNQETESADDFILNTPTFINSATITGLIPAGVSVRDVSQVVVEIYRVFPKDSDLKRTPRVPTRLNSPSDVEFEDRDSSSSNLTYKATVLKASFSAANSVDTGIHPSPNQLTHGDGPVSGQEVRLDIKFDPPFYLPPDHYFFVPQVLLKNPNYHFLWLSAPKPIVAPGTPFTGDLQEWIRNIDLEPDWLRVGTDIVGGTRTFNTTFSLAGDLDTDADHVPDSVDECLGTAPGAIVDSEGCSLDQLVPCSGPASGGAWKNHGAYVSTFAHAAEEFVEEGLITEEEAEALVSAAGQSNCGKKK